MKRRTRFFSASIAAISIMTVTISSPVPASSSSGYWILDTGCWMLDAGYSILDNRFFHQASSIEYQVSRINDPGAEGTVGQNRELDESVAGLPSPARLKSPGKAFLFSAAVPGTGQFYSRAKRGVLFIAAEVAFWTAYVVLHGRGEEIKEDYLDFVDSHIVFEEDSPANSTENWTLEDYEHATQSDNWHYVYTESNGKPVERVGKFYWADLPKDMIDQSGDKPLSQSQSQFRVQAFEKRSSNNDKFKQAKIFLGLVVLNHIISAVDGRVAATVYNNRISETSMRGSAPATGISFHPTISRWGHPGAYLALHRQF